MVPKQTHGDGQVLDRNRIKSLEPDSFKGLTALRELRMEDNGIRRLSHLASLPALRCLQLGGNRVLDLAEVVKLSEATLVVDLSLTGCPIARKPGYRTAVLMRLDHLQVRGGSQLCIVTLSASPSPALGWFDCSILASSGPQTAMQCKNLYSKSNRTITYTFLSHGCNVSARMCCRFSMDRM